jgi:hypothetical protein
LKTKIFSSLWKTLQVARGGRRNSRTLEKGWKKLFPYNSCCLITWLRNSSRWQQGCQLFLGAWDQNWKNVPNEH